MKNKVNSAHLFSMLDNIESKLNRHKISNKSYYPVQDVGTGNNMYQTFGSNFNSVNNNNFINSNNQEISPSNLYKSVPQNFNNPMSSSNEYYIRKLIKDEFSTLILPYQHLVTKYGRML